MIAYVNGQRATDVHALIKGDTPAIVFVEEKALDADAHALGLQGLLLHHVDESAANRFEERRGYDCLLLNIPDKTDAVQAPPINVDIYFNKRLLVFVHDPCDAVDALRALLDSDDPQGRPTFENALSIFMHLLTRNDSDELEDIEESIAALEDEIAENRQENYLSTISTLRKTLLKKKRYFESLVDALDDMTKSESEYLSADQLRGMRAIEDRAERQYHSVINLRDYVTQVREAYQAQIDISLNNTMRLFTVVTTIFLPLTLITGWYGMNLRMPEYDFPYTYPIMLLLSIAVVIGCILYFRRRRWF